MAGRRLILDTGVLVAAERSRMPLREYVSDGDVAIAAITATELWVGVELADDRHRKDRESWVSGVLKAVPIVDYNHEVGRAHARLIAQSRRAGTLRPVYDVMIAATAVATGRALMTTDGKAGLENIPGLDVIIMPN